MDMNIMIERLRIEAANNPVSNSVFHLFATRQRTRGNVWLNNLHTQMSVAGFSYSKEEYAGTLKFMASLGLGALKTTARGHIKGLYDIKLTLQSIGEAALGKDVKIKSYAPRPKFMRLVVPTPKAATETKIVGLDMDLNLVIRVHGKPVQIEIPKNFTNDEIALLLSKWR